MRRVNDKEMAPIDLDQLFENLVETDLLQQFSDFAGNQASSDDLARLFDLPAPNDSDLSGPPTILNRDAAVAWHKALQHSKENPTSPISHDSFSIDTESKNKSSICDSSSLKLYNLLVLEHNQLRSVSQPSIPRPQSARSVKKAVSSNDRATSRGVQKLSKRSYIPALPNMMQASCYCQLISNVWTRKLNATAGAVQLSMMSSEIRSPPLSTKVVQSDGSINFFAQTHQGCMSSQSSFEPDEPRTPGIDFENYQLSPQTPPAVETTGGTFGEDMGMTYSSSASSAALSALHTPPSSLTLPMVTWGPETSPTLGSEYSASPEFSAKPTAEWWNEEFSSSMQAQTGGCQHHDTNTQSTNQTTSMNNAAMNDLGISCDSASFGEFNCLSLGVSVGEDVPTGASASFDMDTYSALYHTPPQQQQQQQQLVPIGHRSLSRSPSPTPQPRFHRRRPSNHSHHSSRASHSSQGYHRKSSNTSQQSSSRQPSTGGTNVSFVNFTPDDSRKILTGVAPSGSSKTRARREKEAAEKRRKLSQAAMKAVMEAGGNLDGLRRLEREGLLVLKS